MGISDASTVCHKNSPIVSPALCGVIDGCLFIGISPDRMDSLQREPGRTEQSCSEFEDACDAKKPLQCTMTGSWR